MVERAVETWPRHYARTCGVLYLYIIAAGTFAELFVRARLIVPGDAAATASNLAASESLFRIGFSAELLHLACDVAIAVILYALFRPIDRNVALLAAFFRLASDVVLATFGLTHLAALRLLGGARYLEAFEPEELKALALLVSRLHGDGYAISLVFFGFACLALGYLIWRSRFLPRILGALAAVAGACYLVSSFAHFLAPASGARLQPFILLPPFVAELALALWLIVKGVDPTRWRAAGSGG